MTSTLGRRLLAHIALRLAAATVLLGAALVVQLRTPGDFGTNPFFALIAITYGVSLAFITSLYVLPIVAASTIQFRRGALQVAAFASLMFAAVVLAQYAQATGNLDTFLGISFLGPLPSLSIVQYTVGLNVFGFFAVAFLSGSLAERLRRADVRLEQASEEIADLQFFNQYVIDNLLSGLATADEQNRILTFNRSAVLITGLSLVTVLNRSAADVLQLPRQFADRLPDELRRSRSKREEVQYRRADGSVINLGLSVAQLPLPDGRRGYLYTFQDTTELKRLERDAQMQKRLAAIGEMAAGIAHEIRNPLASMSGSMQILRQELALSIEQAQLMDIVLRESDRLNDTIRSFLAYARPQRVEVQRLDLRSVVQDTATLLRNSHEVSENHSIEVRTGGYEVLVEGDENQVRQVVWNLATNGLRAMPRGGTLTLSAMIDPVHGGGVLTVTDEGVGISQDEIENIFQPFRGSFGKGTGLGLAIVHRIASDYNAAIDVQSEPGRGTSFRVTFPPAAQRATRAS